MKINCLHFNNIIYVNKKSSISIRSSPEDKTKWRQRKTSNRLASGDFSVPPLQVNEVNSILYWITLYQIRLHYNDYTILYSIHYYTGLYITESYIGLDNIKQDYTWIISKYNTGLDHIMPNYTTLYRIRPHYT